MIEIQPLRLAEVELPASHPNAPGREPVFAYLVIDGAFRLLFDTGIGEGSELVDSLYRPERVPIEHALATTGAAIDSIDAVANSHLHFDHCGGNRLFPDVPIFVQESELEAARAPHYTVREWISFDDARYQPLSGRHFVSPRLELVPTPGHTAGHQSLLAHSQDGVQAVVAQAAHTAREFDAAGEPGFEVPEGHARPDRYLASLANLRRAEPRRAFFSHDAHVWQRTA